MRPLSRPLTRNLVSSFQTFFFRHRRDCKLFQEKQSATHAGAHRDNDRPLTQLTRTFSSLRTPRAVLSPRTEPKRPRGSTSSPAWPSPPLAAWWTGRPELSRVVGCAMFFLELVAVSLFWVALKGSQKEHKKSLLAAELGSLSRASPMGQT